MKCLFGWNTFSAVKTIYAYTPTARFIVRQYVSVFLICISNLNAALHTCGESPITNKKGGLHSKNPPPHDFFANKLFFKQCERHFMPDCNWCLWWCQASPHSLPWSSLKATGLRLLRRNHTNSTHCCSCCVSNQWGGTQIWCPVRTAVQFKSCGCFSFASKLEEVGRRRFYKHPHSFVEKAQGMAQCQLVSVLNNVAIVYADVFFFFIAKSR